MGSLVPAATFDSSSSKDDASLEACAQRLTAAYFAAQDKLAEAEAYVDYTETLYRTALESNLPLPMVAERQAALETAVDALGDITIERNLYATSLRTVLEQLPEED